MTLIIAALALLAAYGIARRPPRRGLRRETTATMPPVLD